MPRHLVRAFIAFVLAGSLGLGATACGDDEAGDAGRSGGGTQTQEPEATAGQPIESPTDIVGGFTTLRLDRRLEDLLGVAGIDVGPAGAATERQDILRVPIERGRVDIDTLSGRLEHRGGLRFGVGEADIRATDLVIDADTGVMSAEVAGQRVPLMTVDLDEPRVPPTGDVFVITGSAGLSQEAAALINDQLGVDVLREGLSLGNVTINAEHR